MKGLRWDLNVKARGATLPAAWQTVTNLKSCWHSRQALTISKTEKDIGKNLEEKPQTNQRGKNLSGPSGDYKIKENAKIKCVAFLYQTHK